MHTINHFLQIRSFPPPVPFIGRRRHPHRYCHRGYGRGGGGGAAAGAGAVADSVGGCSTCRGRADVMQGAALRARSRAASDGATLST